MSHELRAPLTSIKGSAATVLGASPALDPAETLQFFRIIDGQADHMQGLIGALLDAGRIEVGTLTVAPEPSEVAALVDRARNTFLSGGARHTVLIDLPPELPRVMADRRRIVQVLNNLFSNASKHSPESSPIRVAAVRDGVHIAISVSDEGRGGCRPTGCRTCSASAPASRAAMGRADSEGPPGPRHLRGAGGDPWGPHPGRQRRAGLGTTFTFILPVAETTGDGAAAGSPRGRSRPPGKGPEPARILVLTTTRRRCATCAKRSRRRASPRS